MRKKYFFIAGSVIGVSEMEERRAIKRLLSKACERVNHAFREDIFAPMKTIKGSYGVRGALLRGWNAYKIVSMILETIHPRVMRFAIVYGSFRIRSDTGRASRMDRAAAELLGADRAFKQASLVTFSFGDPVTDLLLSSYVNLVLSIKNGWTTRQFEVMTMYAKLENQEKVAKLQGVSQPTISAIMKTADRHHILYAEGVVNYTLNNYPPSSHNIPIPLVMYTGGRLS